MNYQTVVSASKDQVSCDLSGEAAILSLDAGMYYGPDPMGARIWQLLKKPRSIHQILERISQEYDVDRDKLEQDVFHFFHELKQEGLIDIQPSTLS